MADGRGAALPSVRPHPRPHTPFFLGQRACHNVRLPGEEAAAALQQGAPQGFGVGYLVFNKLVSEDGGVDEIEAVARPVPPYADEQAQGASFFSEAFSLAGCATELFAVVTPEAHPSL